MTDETSFNPEMQWSFNQATGNRLEGLENQYKLLQAELAQARNDISLITGLQRSHLDVEERLKKVEDSDNALIQMTAESLIKAGRRIEKLEASIFPKPPETTFDTLDRLVHAIEQTFDCHDGLFGAYADAEKTMEYQTIGLITTSDDHPYERLRMELMKDLAFVSFSFYNKSHPEGKLALYWRFAKEQRIEEESVSHFENDKKVHKIRTRICIPDFSDWPKIRSWKNEKVPSTYRSIDEYKDFGQAR